MERKLWADRERIDYNKCSAELPKNENVWRNFLVKRGWRKYRSQSSLKNLADAFSRFFKKQNKATVQK